MVQDYFSSSMTAGSSVPVVTSSTITVYIGLNDCTLAAALRVHRLMQYIWYEYARTYVHLK